MPARPLVSVVIPAYKPTWFETALLSAYQQTFREAISRFLMTEAAPEMLREIWETDVGRSVVRQVSPRVGVGYISAVSIRLTPSASASSIC